MSDNPVVHFEMPYEDAERVANFYKTAFGWKMDATSPEMGELMTRPNAFANLMQMHKLEIDKF